MLPAKSIIIGLVALIAMVFVNPAAAAESSYSSDLIIKINQEQVVIPSEDQPPVIINDRTYVPLRIISENMGAKVEWHEDSRQVFILWKKQSIHIWPDSRGEDVQIIIDGQILEIPSALGKAYISEKGRTMIPLRAVGEAMDCEVNWIDETRTVDIKYTPAIIHEDLPPVNEDLPEEDPLQAEEAAQNLQLLKDLAVYKTNLKLIDGKVINSEELLNRPPTDFSAEQLEVFRTYLAQLSKYNAVLRSRKAQRQTTLISRYWVMLILVPGS
ncbi:MAG: copper amine oxidase N-terminal domain-containing protein [Syntrophomonadaceae bacterium]|nr:copper amine oxidase N-terminal domain-containing protein [Syntrophomonadaceae bacterium]